MTDPKFIKEAISEVEDAFSYGHGDPEFEPKIDASPEADEGAVMLQKGCRYIDAGYEALLEQQFYISTVEHAFSSIERTFEGYLVLVAGDEPNELRDHTRPYERARGQVPLEPTTIESIEGFYQSNRTTYYYGASVATRHQAEYLLNLAHEVHRHLVEFDQDLEEACIC